MDNIPEAPGGVQTTEVRAKAGNIDSLIHAGIVLTVLGSATALRILGDLDTATISTVYGAALGYATGLTARKSSP